MYTELFKLCGFEPEEIERERPRIDKAFEILEIDDEDVKRGEKRVKEYFDIELQGMRKLLGIWMKELLNLVLAKQEHKKVVYGEWPLDPRPLYAAMLASKDKDVYVTTPGTIINHTIGQIFDKLSPILEAGEQSGLPPGSAHCALWQTRLGALAKGIIPTPDLSITGAFYCDQPSEAEQLMHEIYGIPVVYIDGIVDSNWGEWPESSPSRIQYVGVQTRKALKKCEEIIGCEITEEMKRAAVVENVKGWSNLQPLVELIGQADPQPISQTNMTPLLFLNAVPLRDMEEKHEVLRLLIEEVEQRVDEGRGILEKGAPRIYCGLPIAVDPSIIRMIERTGLAISVCCSLWLTPWQRISSPFKEFGDRIGVGTCVSITHSCEAHITINLEYSKAFRVDGVILLYPVSCRPWAVTPLMSKKRIQEELGIPVLVLEADPYDTRNYSAGQLGTRIEAFAEILRAAKMG